MRSVQVSKANGPFEIVEREVPEPGPRKCVSKSKPAASVTVIISQRRIISRNQISKGSRT